MYQSDALEDQPINTNSIAIPPLPSSECVKTPHNGVDCSLIVSDGENVDSVFSSSAPARKARVYRPIRPAPDNIYRSPEVSNSVESLPPPISIVNTCDPDPVFYLSLILCSACSFHLHLSAIFKCQRKKRRLILILKQWRMLHLLRTSLHGAALIMTWRRKSSCKSTMICIAIRKYLQRQLLAEFLTWLGIIFRTAALWG